MKRVDIALPLFPSIGETLAKLRAPQLARDAQALNDLRYALNNPMIADVSSSADVDAGIDGITIADGSLVAETEVPANLAEHTTRYYIADDQDVVVPRTASRYARRPATSQSETAPTPVNRGVAQLFYRTMVSWCTERGLSSQSVEAKLKSIGETVLIGLQMPDPNDVQNEIICGGLEHFMVRLRLHDPQLYKLLYATKDNWLGDES